MTEPQFTTEELNSEEWKPVYGLEELYAVSSLGRVRRIGHLIPGRKTVDALKPLKDKYGYCAVMIGHRGQKQKRLLVHRIVMAAFHYPVNGRDIQVNHIDGNKSNNRLSNLEYVSPRENWEHAVRIGLRSADFPEVRRRARGATHYSRTKPEAIPRGSRHGRAKITEETVREIRIFYLTTKSYKKVAAHFGLGKTTILHIIKGDTWKHVL